MKPSIPRGTRDFGPVEMQKRQYILDIIRKNFELFGYQAIETPAMENIGTLTGKYGEEGDKLIFKILDSGEYIEPISEEYAVSFRRLLQKSLAENKSRRKTSGYTVRSKHELNRFLEVFSSKKLTKEISEKALRYDLTVPFARFVVMNQHTLTFPFKRYQIQPVWRADRPQKGRYREFYQCDADVIGSNSLINELELITLMDKTFSELNLPIVLKINNRKVLAGIAEIMGTPERLVDITIAIDKLDKIGFDLVMDELTKKGLPDEALNQLKEFLRGLPLQVSREERLNQLKVLFESKGSQSGVKGVEELQFIFDSLFDKIGTRYTTTLEFDLSLARGLNYYTGAIFEVKANAGTFTPSILGGGRYDDLTGIFGLPNMSGVGISFGVDRIYDVMEELNLFPESLTNMSTTKLLLTHFDELSQQHCLMLAVELRKNDIACEVYPDITKKIGKQLDYANKKNIPFVCTIGSNEIEKGAYSIKKMSSGEKQELNISDMIHYLKTELHDLHN